MTVACVEPSRYNVRNESRSKSRSSASGWTSPQADLGGATLYGMKHAAPFLILLGLVILAFGAMKAFDLGFFRSDAAQDDVYRNYPFPDQYQPSDSPLP